jgi:hypothetical protein
MASDENSTAAIDISPTRLRTAMVFSAILVVVQDSMWKMRCRWSRLTFLERLKKPYRQQSSLACGLRRATQ